MSSLPPLQPWLVRLLIFAGGYALRWWSADRGAGSDSEWESEEDAPRRRPPRRRVAAPAEELKLVLVVNSSLKMGKGKIGAQCAHAAVGIVERLAPTKPVLLAQWEGGGQAKICLSARDDVELRSLAAAAGRAGLATYLVHDAGRTQIPAGSRTVLAVGPAPRSAVDKVTGHLKLL